MDMKNKRPLMERLKRGLRLYYLHLIRMKDSPHKVAGGMAVGVLLAILPGMGTIAAIVLSSLLRLNRSAAILGTLILNPIAQIPIWVGSYPLGSLLMGQGWRISSDVMEKLRELQHVSFMSVAGFKVYCKVVGKVVMTGGMELLLGFTLITLLITSLSYLFTFKIMVVYQSKKRAQLHSHKG